MKTSFDANGTEGMLDVILGCTLIFILLTALIRVDEGTSREVTLPDVNLSSAARSGDGSEAVKKTVISMKMNGETPEIFINDRPVDLRELDAELENMKHLGRVALRRDQELPCRWEDEIILRCQKAGVPQVAIMVKAER